MDRLGLVAIAPFRTDALPPLGALVRLALDAQKPTGEAFRKGDPAVICEHSLSTDGRISVGARTTDGLVLRATFAEAFEII